jgi:hypothetical protein
LLAAAGIWVLLGVRLTATRPLPLKWTATATAKSEMMSPARTGQVPSAARAGQSAANVGSAT